MCGLAGILRFFNRPIAPDDITAVGRMARVIGHRGPDQSTGYSDHHLALQFERLAILDSVRGSQPFYSSDGSVVVVYNGEIYNHRELRRSKLRGHCFRSDSDGEVLPHLYERYGLSFVEHLQGMYAVTVWDKRARKLFLVRDRMGIKPIYYTAQRDSFLFASEIKALLTHPDCPRDFDWHQALSDPWVSEDLAFCGDAPPTFFKDIYSVPPGSYLEISPADGQVVKKEYWSFQSKLHAPRRHSDKQFIEQYGELLEASCKLCSQSDADVGLMLSGGIDSAAIAALSAPKIKTLETFSVLSASTVANGDARAGYEVAQHLGLMNHQVAFQGDMGGVSFDHWQHIVQTCESPLCGIEQLFKYNLYRYVKNARPGTKVMLLGQGSDELNGGYSRLIAPPEEQNWNGFISSLRFIRRTQHFAGLPSGVRSWEASLGVPLFRGGALNWVAEQDEDLVWQTYVLSKFRDLQIFNLWLEDRIAAGVGIENRVPFLDHRLVELTLSVPSNLRPTLFWDKAILRQAVRELLPQNIIERPKVPFFHGSNVAASNRLALHVLGPHGEAIEDVICGDIENILDREALRIACDRIREDPEATNVGLLIRLVNMALLHRMTKEAQWERTPEHREIIEAGFCLAGDLPYPDVDDILGLRRKNAIDPTMSVLLEDGVSLLYCVSGDDKETWVIARHGLISFTIAEELRESWVRFLRAGRHAESIEDVCKRLSLNQEQILEHIEQAVELRLVRLERFVPPGDETYYSPENICIRATQPLAA